MMTTTTSMTDAQAQALTAAAWAIRDGFVWKDTPQGAEYWANVCIALTCMARHRTPDGKPAQDETPPSPEDRGPSDCVLRGPGLPLPQ